MACIAHINLEVVDLTFGEVCEAPQRDRVHRGKQEDSSGESLSVASEFSVVKLPMCAEGIL